MADITLDFNVCLKEQGATPVLKHAYDLGAINSFLQEAYSINARIVDLIRELRSIRSAYLSVLPASRRRHVSSSNEGRDPLQPLTDAERDAVDAQSKQLLRQLNNGITNLKQAEDVRNQTADSVALSKRARGGLGAIGRWAAGGAVTAKSIDEERQEAQRKTVAAVRESIIMYLQQALDQAGRIQSEMMGIRLDREVEKSKSVLYKSRGAGGIPYGRDEAVSIGAVQGKGDSGNHMTNGILADSATMSPGEERLSAEQMQVFASENADLLRHYEDQLDQVRQAESSILEISELHSTLHANLQQQSEHIDQLVQDSYLTTENLGRGNKELKRASERRSTAQTVFWGTIGFCSFLVVWDLVF